MANHKAGTKRVSLSRLEIHPADESRWADVERLFGLRGACAGCWCMFWRRPRREWEAAKGTGNKRALRRLISSGEEPGILAYWRDEPVGWCALAPREAYGYLERSRLLRPVDDRPVWSVSCLFVARPFRRKGISVRLLRAAAAHAAGRGARILEGYPSEPGSERAPDAFIWLGTAAAFRRAGFHEAARRSPTRPIMRRHLRAAGS